MNLDLHRPSSPESQELRTILCRRLRLDPGQLRPDVPLTRYGLDSLAAAEIVIELEERFSKPVPAEAWGPSATLNSLCALVRDGIPERSSEPASMTADGQRLDELSPSRPRAHGVALLSGATGFLGAHLLVELLQRHDRVICVVRANDPTEARRRVLRNLEHHGLSAEARRIEAWPGQLESPAWDLAAEAQDRLQRTVSRIVHAGASVDWVSSYTALREVNVVGTSEGLRFAAGAGASFDLVSSLLVTYAQDTAAEVDESWDAFAHREDLPLGYARSKAVAEELTRKAAARGLRTAIHRPGLISFDRLSGIAARDDLLRRVLAASIQCGLAPDLDWPLSTCAVDHVAAGLVGAEARFGTPLIEHWVHREDSRWAELVLWARLWGHPLRLVPYSRWREEMDLASRSANHPLAPLRPFFVHRQEDGRTRAEFYAGRRSVVQHRRSARAQTSRSLPPPRLEVEPLTRWFEREERDAKLPPASIDLPSGTDTVTARSAVLCVVPETELDSFERIHGESILSELVAGRKAPGAGLFRVQRLRDQPPLIVKSKASDLVVAQVSEALAGLYDPQLEQEFLRARPSLESVDVHRREIALATLDQPELRSISPSVVATHSGRRQWVIAMEDFAGGDLLPSWQAGLALPSPQIASALGAIGRVHEAFADADPDPSWHLYRPPSPHRNELRALHAALVEHAAADFEHWGGGDAARRLRDAVDELPDTRRRMQQVPSTLCHGDFNPRNVAFQGDRDSPRARVFDWELARWEAPVRDVVEFLCFSLTSEVRASELHQWLELARTQSAPSVDGPTWRDAASAALAVFLVERLPLYHLVHRFRPRRFLPAVVRTTMQLERILHATARHRIRRRAIQLTPPRARGDRCGDRLRLQNHRRSVR